MLGAEVEFLEMAALAQIPHVQAMAIIAFDQALKAQPVLEHLGRAPFGCYRDIVAEMPPEVIAEILWAAVDLPLAKHIEVLVVEQENPTRTSFPTTRAHSAY